MLTGRMRIRVPGILAPMDTDTPSSGWTVNTSWLAWMPTEPELCSATCGICLSTTAISVSLRARRLPVRR